MIGVELVCGKAILGSSGRCWEVMETSRGYKRVRFLLLYITIAAILFTDCEARRKVQPSRRPRHPRGSVIKTTKKLRVTKHLNINPLLESVGYSVSSPFSLPPFESLGPMPLPENTPPYCLYPPNTPGTPSTTIPAPVGYTPSSPPSAPYFYLPPVLPSQSPPPSPEGTIPGTPEFTPTPYPPEIVPSPPSIVPGSPQVVPSPPIYIPSPPGSTLSPPYYEPSPPIYVPSPPSYVPSPTGFVPSPPSYVPSPTGFVPSPPVFEPPVVFPPPTVPPPPPNTASSRALWCVAKPSVPDPIIQEAMDYACWSGADCDSILPQGSCFQPNTLFAHASYAFNSYWQRTKVAGGTCEFGGTAMLVTVDPSYDGCHFLYL